MNTQELAKKVATAYLAKVTDIGELQGMPTFVTDPPEDEPYVIPSVIPLPGESDKTQTDFGLITPKVPDDAIRR